MSWYLLSLYRLVKGCFRSRPHGRSFILQGDTSGYWKPPIDWVLTVPAAGGPLLQLSTTQKWWFDIPNQSRQEVFTILVCHSVCDFDDYWWLIQTDLWSKLLVLFLDFWRQNLWTFILHVEGLEGCLEEHEDLEDHERADGETVDAAVGGVASWDHP